MAGILIKIYVLILITCPRPMFVLGAYMYPSVCVILAAGYVCAKVDNSVAALISCFSMFFVFYHFGSLFFVTIFLQLPFS